MALFSMVGHLRIDMKGMRGGIISNLWRQNKGRVKEDQMGRSVLMSYSIVGWSDFALFSIFENLHVSADQVYF